MPRKTSRILSGRSEGMLASATGGSNGCATNFSSEDGAERKAREGITLGRPPRLPNVGGMMDISGMYDDRVRIPD
jgi:hypothetical protein